MPGLTHGSLFSGIGGFELGAQMSGIPTIWNCEIEPFPRSILKKHFPNTKQYEDITKIKKIEYTDIISGGFPCQDISICGPGKGINGTRSGLWSEMFRLCRLVKPKYIIIENSPMLLIRGFEQVLCDLSKIGYGTEWQSLQAAQFGYNHKRERLFAIAYPHKKRCKNHPQAFRKLSEVLPKRTSKQINISMPTKRIDGKTDFAALHLDDGFSSELDYNSIAALGNAVVPEITHYLFECIKLHNEFANTN